MPLRTMGSTAKMDGATPQILHVVNRLKMIRPDTGSIPTQMIKF